MEKKEIKISSFQAENYRLQLIYVTKELTKKIKRIYQVRENRKIVCSSVTYDNAKAVYARCIDDKLGNKNNLCFQYMPDQILLHETNNNGAAMYFIDQEKIQEFINSKSYYQAHKYMYNNIKHKLLK